MASAPPQLPQDHATALQHRRQGVCEDSDVMLRGHKWPRRSARPIISFLGVRMGGVIEGYILWAVATSVVVSNTGAKGQLTSAWL